MRPESLPEGHKDLTCFGRIPNSYPHSPHYLNLIDSIKSDVSSETASRNQHLTAVPFCISTCTVLICLLSHLAFKNAS